MNLSKLKMPTVVVGRDVFGRLSALILQPNGRADGAWTLSLNGNPKKEIVISSETVAFDAGRRNLTLCHEGRSLHVAEHILPLMFLGLRGVRLVASKKWPPYAMPSAIWKQTSSVLQFTEMSTAWKTVRSTTEWQYPRARNGKVAFTRIEQHSEPTLIADVTVSYPGLGTKRRIFDLSTMSQEELLAILAVGPQGWYPAIGLVEHVLRSFNWPHVNGVVWPRFKSGAERDTTLDQFLKHRFLDLLGALALLSDGEHLPAVKVTSVCSGHEADFRAICEAKLSAVVS